MDVNGGEVNWAEFDWDGFKGGRDGMGWDGKGGRDLMRLDTYMFFFFQVWE